MTEPIPKEILARAYRSLMRRSVAALVSALAERDSSFAEMAARIDQPEGDLRKWFHRMIEGEPPNGKDDDFRWLSDCARALECRPEMSLRPLPEPWPTVQECVEQERQRAAVAA